MKKAAHAAFRFEGTITPAQQQYFNKHGIIQFRNFVDKATVARFIRETEQVQDQLLRYDIRKVNGIPLKFGHDDEGRPFIQRIAFASQYSTVLSNFLKDKRLDALKTLLQPYDGRISENEKDGLVVNHYLNTANSEFRQLGWHTDSPRDLFLGTRIMPMLNVGLHLDDCPFSHGGLRVLPGSHHQGLFRLLFRKKYFIDHQPDKKEVGFDIEAGDLTIHDGRLWHRVQQSPFTGEKSRRRVMYIPVITGAYQPRHAGSPTPFYHRLAQLKLRPAATKNTPVPELHVP